MVQETFETFEVFGGGGHLNLAIDYSMITLDTHWDPKAKRIYNAKAEVQGQPEPEVEQPKPVPKSNKRRRLWRGKVGDAPLEY
ncbi:hypothetical protein PIB30_103823, partial [Stylosanthes scabra]|nr:hypothetical protein [Stylosanthes scabra]